MVLPRLLNAKNHRLRLMVLDILGVAAFASPALFGQVCARKGEDFTNDLFNHWLSYLPTMKGYAVW